MSRIKAFVSKDSDQGARSSYFLCCPECRQKLADVEQLQGVVSIRFKCRRCGTYVKAEIVGVDNSNVENHG